MAGKINGEGIKGPIPVIQPYGEFITCQKCGHVKIRYKRDFPYCYQCYMELVRNGEIIDS